MIKLPLRHTAGHLLAPQACSTRSTVRSVYRRTASVEMPSVRVPSKDGSSVSQRHNEREELVQQSSSLSSLLGAESLQQARDVAASLILAEAVYKVLDGETPDGAVQLASKAAAQLPEQLRQSLRLQWSLPHVTHRYLVAEGDHTLYVAFMGTKAWRDLITNATVLQELLWKEHRFSIEGEPAAHTGFVRRARSIPIKFLLELAEGKGKKLVLCGHSLGGAVAEICALDLLHAAPKHRPPNIQAVGFASPAIGNAALASLVKKRGWQPFLTNYLLPEDRIGGLLGFSPLPNSSEEPSLAILAEEGRPFKEPASKQPSQTAKITVTAGLGFHPLNARHQNEDGGEDGRLPSLLKSNIVAFQTPPQASRLQQDSLLAPVAVEKVAKAAEKMGVTSWAARFLYRMLTFPLWAHKSFVPVSQRLYLNSEGISSYPGMPTAAALAAASMPAGIIAGLAQVEAFQEASKSSAAHLRRRQLIMWMHRLPSYRARLSQIGKVLADSSLLKESSSDSRISLSTDAGPATTISQAVALAPASNSKDQSPVRLLLEDCLKASGFPGLWPQHWRALLDASAEPSQSHFRLRGLLHWFWSGLRGQLKTQPLHPANTVILVKVDGRGLQHVSKYQLTLSDGYSTTAEVVESSNSPLWRCLEGKLSGGRALSTFLSWLHLAAKGRKQPVKQHLGEGVLLRAEIPALGRQDGLNGLRLEYQSDFWEGSIAVQGLEKEACNQFSKSGKGLKWRDLDSDCLCNEC